MSALTRPPVPRGAAEQFFLTAHDHRGKPQLTKQALEFGSASGLLGELVINDYVMFPGEGTQLCERGRTLMRSSLPQQDPTVVALLLNRISRTPTFGPRDWIAHFAPRAPVLIARRLAAAGVVEVARPSWVQFWRSDIRYVPYDQNEPHKVGDHLTLALRGRSELTLQDLFLAGLLRATQLHHARIDGAAQVDRVIATKVEALSRFAHLPTAARDHSVRLLLTAIEDLVTEASLAQTL